MQIVAVNEANEAIVPFTEPGNILREQHMKGNPLTHLITHRFAPVPPFSCVFFGVQLLVCELPLSISLAVHMTKSLSVLPMRNVLLRVLSHCHN